MAAKQSSTKSTRPKRSSPGDALDDGLRQLEKQLPKNLAGGVKELRKNLRDLQRQIDKARKERDDRWQKLENQIRKDAARALRRLEKAVAPASKPARKKTAKKAARKAPARKKAAKKAAG